MRQRYAEFAPSPSLAAEIRCIWIFEAPAGDAPPQRIVPDGRPELIVHFGAPFLETIGGRDEAQARAVFAGQISRPLWLKAGGAAGVLGVRFHSAGARRFLGMSLNRQSDARLDIATLWPREARDLSDAMAEARGDAARVALAEAFVATRIAIHGNARDDGVAHCVALIERGGARLTIDDLTRAAGVGARQLERRFLDAVGVPPRLLASLLRFRRVFDAIEHGGRWTDAALAAGYFDQSHLIRDFRRFAGCTPTELAGDDPGLARALVETTSQTYNPGAGAKG